MPIRVSLVEVSWLTGRMLAVFEAGSMMSPHPLREISPMISYSPPSTDVRIWLNGQQMLLMRSSSFGICRKEFIFVLCIKLESSDGCLARV
jgi:hypothetical protein